MIIQPADIVGIPFPYSDMATKKRRPVLVLTMPDDRGDFAGLAVTSVRTEKNAVCIRPEAMKSGKLPKTSWIRYDKIFTLDSSLVKKKYGSLQDEMFSETVQCLCDHLGCESSPNPPSESS